MVSNISRVKDREPETRPMNHLISLTEQSKEEIQEILQLARILKDGTHTHQTPLYQKTLIMLFQKTSTRTRLSFETAMTQLGGHAIYVDFRSTQMALTDFQDEIKAIMQFGDILMFRALHARDVISAASLNIIPVIDGCSEKYHPCQALGDMLTMAESVNGLQNIKKIAWLGIQNNVSNTLMLACAKLGIECVLISPERNKGSIDGQLDRMAFANGLVHVTADIQKGLEGVQFVHTDTWMDMEFFQDGVIKDAYKEEYERRIAVFRPYQLNAKLIDTYAPQAKIMHCMPCHVGYEITRDAIDHKNSIIFQQAKNRLHIQKACLVWLAKHAS